MTLTIAPAGRFGAEIIGVEAAALDDEDFAALRAAFIAHGVVFFRDQHLGENEHIAFARRWGAININRFFTPHPGHPEIALVVKEPWQQHNIGGGWHTDHSYDEVPALGSILVAREVPPTGGGTSFISMYDAYAALPDYLVREIEGLRAVHSTRHVFGSKAARSGEDETRRDGRVGNSAAADLLEDVTHPVVITHPLSGRRALYVNPGFTIGLVGRDADGSRQLLEELYAHTLNGDFAIDFAWREGSIAMWDNRATWHFASNDYQGHRREMHRITIEGEPLA